MHVRPGLCAQAEVVQTAFEVLKPRSLRLARSGDTALVVSAGARIGCVHALVLYCHTITCAGVGETNGDRD